MIPNSFNWSVSLKMLIFHAIILIISAIFISGCLSVQCIDPGLPQANRNQCWLMEALRSKDPDYCNRIQRDQILTDLCYIRVAALTKNISYCEKVTFGSKHSCYCEVCYIGNSTEQLTWTCTEKCPEVIR